MMLRVSKRLLSEVRFDVFTSGGPGGQHANRTLSAVRARHLPTGISAIARDHRSQLRNRELALERLILKLKSRQQRQRPRIATRISAFEKARRQEQKICRSQLKLMRRKPNPME